LGDAGEAAEMGRMQTIRTVQAIAKQEGQELAVGSGS